MSRAARASLALLALLCAGAASAQTYTVSSATAPYAPLAHPTVPTLNGDSDFGWATIPIGFDFPYFGKTYTAITITTDGMAYFEPNPGASSYPTNTVLPSGAAPQAVLAPFWDDLGGSNALSQLGYELTTLPTGKVLAIEWAHWNELNFQIRLHENGIIEFHYGKFTGTGQPLTATIGIEDPTGTIGLMAKACASSCASSDVSENELLTFGPGPNTVDLIAGPLRVDSVTETNGTLNVTTSLDLSNFGSNAATGVSYALYLSSDTILDPSDVPLSPATQGPLSIGALGRITHTATSTVAKPASGAWFVLANVDPANAITETSETNNLAATVTPIVAGVDLVAQDITCNVSASGPGEPIVNDFHFTNIGIDSAGTVQWRIYASKDTTLDPSDVLMGSGTLAVAGGQSVSLSIPYNVPGTLPAGTYYFALQLAAAPSVTELSQTNNVVFSSSTFTNTPVDLVVGPVSVLSAQSPFDPAPVLYFGEPVRVEATVINRGGATARNFSLDVMLSNNDVLSFFSDQYVGSVPNLTLSPGQSITVVFTGTVPQVDRTNTPYAPANYYFFASASDGQFVDADPGNNSSMSHRQPITNPGPDLMPASISAQSEIASGEVIPVTRVLRNVGHKAALSAKYRFYLSRNELLTEEDIPLPIQHEDGTSSDEGEVTLGPGAFDVNTEWVRLPASIPPGTYFLGVFMDPDHRVAEIDESNNGGTPCEVTVVPSPFAVSTAPLLDAVLQMPYVQSLTTIGGVPPVTFSLAGGSALPPGIVMTPDGQLSGTPSETGIYALMVEAKDAAGQRTTAALVLRVIPSAGAVTITSTVLPAPVRHQPYRAGLSAQGGKPPYRWSLESGTLPEGIELGPTGGLGGTPTGPANETSEFVVRVIDSVGNSSTARLMLTPVAPGSLYLSAKPHPIVQVGSEFEWDVVARSATDEPIAGPLQWRLISGRLPAGLRLEEAGPNVLLLRGIPAETGIFPLSIQVVDARDRDDGAHLILEVVPALGELTSTVPRRVLRGRDVSGVFRLNGEVAHVAVESGELPPGVSVSEDGTVSGTIPDDAPYGLRTFTVRARLDSGVTAIASYSIEVVDQVPDATSRCGCTSSSAAPAIAPITLLLLAVTLRRPRPQDREGLGGPSSPERSAHFRDVRRSDPAESGHGRRTTTW